MAARARPAVSGCTADTTRIDRAGWGRIFDATSELSFLPARAAVLHCPSRHVKRMSAAASLPTVVADACGSGAVPLMTFKISGASSVSAGVNGGPSTRRASRCAIPGSLRTGRGPNCTNRSAATSNFMTQLPTGELPTANYLRKEPISLSYFCMITSQR